MASSADPTQYKLVFFAPPQHLTPIKDAIFATSAGSHPGKGNYTQCCFTTPGVGQFLPGGSADPAIGQPGKVEEVGEVRCEMVCVGQEVAKDAVEALKKVHPYETPAYEVYKIEPF
ncbi:hypothetical protein LTR37_013810 [Vermiconidia calcicola]|uniref:Uncharacterized protein n=1 Tax=Vermiconidia calcicola TaxID=1690605 RepID=A0ACC3MVF8_9PEZI|nr:hypothetical protein LTR37_013810 [Vermiconidia calcicola]